MSKYSLSEINDKYVDVLREIGNIGVAMRRQRLPLCCRSKWI